jgi:hypothetical protein
MEIYVVIKGESEKGKMKYSREGNLVVKEIINYWKNFMKENPFCVPLGGITDFMVQITKREGILPENLERRLEEVKGEISANEYLWRNLYFAKEFGEITMINSFRGSREDLFYSNPKSKDSGEIPPSPKFYFP